MYSVKLKKFKVQYKTALQYFSEPKLADTNFVIKFVFQSKFGKLGIFKSKQIMLQFESCNQWCF